MHDVGTMSDAAQRIASFVLVVVGFLAISWGWPIVGIVSLCLWAAMVVVSVATSMRRRRAPQVPPAPLDPDQATTIRAERERKGEIAAIRLLRKQRPELSLADAVQLMRGL
jgi:hypothetical protein